MYHTSPLSDDSFIFFSYEFSDYEDFIYIEGNRTRGVATYYEVGSSKPFLFLFHFPTIQD